jgi:ActR/RegA family two-component response regulator
VESATGSSPRPELAATLHRLRSTLARIKAELELAEVDDTPAPIKRLLADLEEAFVLLSKAEAASQSHGEVLVVDDDGRLAEMTARGLRRLGYEADSSHELRPLREHEILVFDLGMLPGLDASARKSVRAARPIVVTGATDPSSRAVASSLDASDYLVKPVELDELAAAIRRRMAAESREHGPTPFS